MNSSSELFCIRNSKYLLKLKIVEIYLKNSLLKYLELPVQRETISYLFTLSK